MEQLSNRALAGWLTKRDTMTEAEQLVDSRLLGRYGQLVINLSISVIDSI